MMDINFAMGMSRTTGALLPPPEHLRQSINDILMTPIGSRLLRREYGSLLPFLIDQPANPATKLKIMAAIATAIVKWEPRVKVRQVQLSMNADATNDTGNTGVNVLLDLRRSDNTKLPITLTLARGAS
nr:GPW/gp25 family protein [Moraxella sp. CTOTU47616]